MTDRVARESFASALQRLSAAQKPAARSAPAYSRFVNRRLGRVLAAAAQSAGLSPNAVTGISAVFTFSSLVLLVLLPPSWPLGIGIALLLLVGYALDSADGQLSRLQGTSSPAGEWLDHMVDSVKVVSIPVALTIAVARFDYAPGAWVLVPLLGSIVASSLFFSIILTEQLRRAHGTASLASDAPGRPSWRRALAVLPMDYGVLCLSFVLLGAPLLFFVVYALIQLFTAVFLVLAAAKWFREISAWEPARRRDPAGEQA